MPKIMTDNNNHIDIDTLIARYFASEASETELEYLMEWIRESDENRKCFFELQDIWHGLNPSFEAVDIDLQNAEEKILVKSGLRRKRLSWIKGFMKLWSRIAAILLLPLILLVVYRYVKPANSQDAIREISTAYGCSMKTVLPDGTAVWLNANSTLKYPSEFEAKRREVDLTGEAYFDVHSDAKHPFVVHAAGLDVEATGTEFNVNSYGTGSTSVTLVSGNVNVGINGNDRRYDMVPGDYLKLHDGQVNIRKGCDTEKYCSWRNGVLMFDDDTLQEICNRLEQIYNVRFDITDPKVAALRYCMTLRGENITEIMDLLELSAPVRCTYGTVNATDSVSTTQIITIASI